MLSISQLGTLLAVEDCLLAVALGLLAVAFFKGDFAPKIAVLLNLTPSFCY